MTSAVLFGGPGPEHNISILTGLQVHRLLSDSGMDIIPIYWTQQASFLRVAGQLDPQAFLEPEIAGAEPLQFEVPDGFSTKKGRRSKPLSIDSVINCCHGGPGEEGALTAMLALAGIHVSGPSPVGPSAVAMDKLATYGVAVAAGVRSIPTSPLSAEVTEEIPFDPPWVVKARYGGSSIGVELGVDKIETLKGIAKGNAFSSGIVIQPFKDGWIDLNISVRTHPSIEVSAIEKPIYDGYYDYKAKYLAGQEGMDSAQRELNPELPPGVREELEAEAIKIVKALRLTGVPRIDFMWDGNRDFLFNEVNPIPGVLGMYLWQEADIKREQLLTDMLDEGRSSSVWPSHWSIQSDPAVLHAAASTSSKLA